MKYLDQISQLNIEMFFSVGQTGPFLTINAVRDFWNGAVKDGAGRNTHKRPLQKNCNIIHTRFCFVVFFQSMNLSFVAVRISPVRDTE